MIFKKTVKADYQKSVLFEEEAEYSNSQNLLNISDKVRIKDTRGNLKADKLSFDLKIFASNSGMFLFKFTFGV